MNVPEKHRAVAHAWVDGAEIEYKGQGCFGDWAECPRPAWAASFDYRIKPKAKVKKWRWVYVDGSFANFGVTSDFYSESEASCRCYVQKIDSTKIEVDE